MKTLALLIALIPLGVQADKITIYEGTMGTNVPRLLGHRTVIDTETGRGYRTVPGTDVPNWSQPIQAYRSGNGYVQQRPFSREEVDEAQTGEGIRYGEDQDL